MAAFRLYDQHPLYWTTLGAQAAGGSLNFYNTGTTTPKSVYGEKALTTNNGATLTLDSGGRPSVDIWLSGSYRVILKDAGGATIWSRDDVEESGGSGTALPALVSAQFLTNNGAVTSWAAIAQVPDPTGNAGEQLGTDGTAVFWEPKPTVSVPVADIVQDATSLKVKSMLMQTGTDATTSYATKTASRAVTFAKAYDVAPLHVSITPTNSSVASGGGLPTVSATGISTTGFTANFAVGEIDDTQAQYNFNVNVTFNWLAIGVRVAA